MRKYDHKNVEKKWQKIWEESAAYKTEENSSKPKEYVLDMFPYPSGAGLHVGHVEGYTATDIYSRYKRARGYNVLHPMGWDAFGLPAENYAIKTGTPPRKTTNESIDNFRKQIKNLGLSYDWSREFGTHTPEYYKWTQWLFAKFFEKGLVYKKKALVNWDPVDQTVLANEQVLPDGTAERSGAKVEKKELEQWFFKITDYADELISGLDSVDWPESTKINQRNWIGKSEGAEIEFPISNSQFSIKIFTTRPDTLYGATYMVLAPEHALVAELSQNAANKAEIDAYVAASKNKSDIDRSAEGKEKTGVVLEGVKAINPANKEEIPVYIADYVLSTYGTGAIMAVPAHDERDFAFAQKYNLPITQVVASYTLGTGENAPRSEENIVYFDAATAIIKHWEKELYYVVDFSPTLRGFVGGHVEPGETTEQTACREVMEESGYTDIKSVKPILTHAYSRGYKVRKSRDEECHDSLFLVELRSDARQEIVDSETKQGNWLTAQEVLNIPDIIGGHHKQFFETYLNKKPFTARGKLVDSGEFSGLMSEEAKKKITEFVGGKITKTYRLRDWLISRQRYWGAPIPIVYDPEGKPHAVPDEHLPWLLAEDVEYMPKGTSPLGSSKELLERTERIFGKGWKPEIDTMDTFACSSWYFFRFADPHNAQEFTSKEAMQKWLPVDLYLGGAEHTVLHLLYARFFTKALRDMGYLSFDEPFLKLRHQGIILAEDSRKMSKRWGNVINPDDMVERFGADSVRLYEMFMGPLEAMKPWNTDNVMGVRRFLERAWALAEKVSPTAIIDEKTSSLMHQTIDKVTKDIEALKCNTAISALMILSNHLAELQEIPKEAYVTFIQLLMPFAPHAGSELLAELGESDSTWPTFDPSKVQLGMVEIAVQVNGKVRGTVVLSPTATESEALEAAKSVEQIAKWLEGKSVTKAVYVAGKVINFVVG